MPRKTASRVIAMWTRSMLDELAPKWRRALPLDLTDAAALRGNDPYIAHEDMVALWSHFTDDHPDQLYGIHFAERHADRGVGMYAHAASHAPDFGTGARACMQLQRLIDTDSTITMVPVDRNVAIRHVTPDGIGVWPRHLAESLAGGTLHLARKFTGSPLTPVSAHFQHERPPAATVKAVKAWLGCTVTYADAWNALVFDQATLDLPFRHSDPTTFSAIVSAATRTLDAMAPPSQFVDEVRAALRARRGERVSVATLAQALGLSDRTLQRRLGESGVTFRQLADEIRVEVLAEESLAPRKSRATADAIGFADPSSVRRLRKRWRRPKS